MYDIVSIGAASVDFVVCSDDILVKNNLLSLPYSAKTEIQKSQICSGGGATNSAVSFSRLGLKSACISLVGSDPLSTYVYSQLKDDHVPSSLITQSNQEITDFSIILVAADGGRTIMTNRGSTCLKEKDIPWKKIQKCKWLYLTSLEGNINLLEKIIGFAVENNIKIALNPGSREINQAKILIPLLKYVDFLLLNLVESEALTGKSFSSKEYWPKLVSFASKIVAITNGRQGAYVYAEGQHLYSPIINTTPVDETGAGDSFGSAFVAALNYHLPPQDAIFWGIKNSASVVSHLGAKSGLLTYEQIYKTTKSSKSKS